MRIVFCILTAFVLTRAETTSQQNVNVSTGHNYVPVDSRDYFPWQVLITTDLARKADENFIVSLFDMENLLQEPSLIDIRIDDDSPKLQVREDKTIIYTDPSVVLELPDNIKDHYEAEIAQLPMKQPLNEMNAWCSNVTDGDMQQLLNESDIIGLKILILRLSYFSVQWQSKFTYTYQTTFYTTPKQSIIIDAMEQISYFYYLDSQILGAKMLRLSQAAHGVAMFILLPHAKAGANELLESLHNDQIKRAQSLMESTKVRVVMPKFKYNFKVNFKRDLLQHLLQNQVFKGSNSRQIFGEDVEKANIFQLTGITVDEAGGESARRRGKNENTHENVVQYIVNRPFVFFVEEETTGRILYLGKVINPTV